MEKIIEQLAAECGGDIKAVNSVEIDHERHTVNFKYVESRRWAKLSRNNKTVLKNSVRLDY